MLESRFDLLQEFTSAPQLTLWQSQGSQPYGLLATGVYVESPEDGFYSFYDPDGRRFLMFKGSSRPPPRPHLVAVQNWFEELQVRVPVP